MNQYNLPEDTAKEPHLTRYIRFVSNRANRELLEDVMCEKHHILPKSMGGSADSSNIIKLTLREHYIVHLILWKCYGGSMANAFWSFQYQKKTKKIRDTLLSSKQFEELRREEIFYQRNKKLSEEHKRKISESHKGEKNPMFGKVGFWKGKKRSKETIEKMSKGMKGKYSGEKNHFYGKTHSEESLEKMRRFKGEGHPANRAVECIETGEVFYSIVDASFKKTIIKSHISECCRGKRKTAGKLHWKYIEEEKTN